MIERGSAFLLKVGDGAASPAFATVAGLRTTQLSVNGEAVVVTNKDSGGWRQLLSGAGVRSVSVSGEMLVLRPSFAALVAAEAELGPLFALVERAAEGRLALADIAGLFWHTVHERPGWLTRDALGEALVAGGLADATPVLRVLMGQILGGR